MLVVVLAVGEKVATNLPGPPTFNTVEDDFALRIESKGLFEVHMLNENPVTGVATRSISESASYQPLDCETEPLDMGVISI